MRHQARRQCWHYWNVETQILTPLKYSPWRLVTSGVLLKAIIFLVGTVALASVTFFLIVLFPLLPFWAQILGQIDAWRSRPLLPEPLREERQFSWNWNLVWKNAFTSSAWRQGLVAVLEMVLGLLAFMGAMFTAAFAVVAYRLIVGEGIWLTATRWVFHSGDPLWQRILASIVAIAVVLLFIYLLVALALIQVFLIRGLLSPQALEEQIEKLSEKNTEMVTAFEVERQRIERELHDGPQQHLANAAIQLGLARNQLGSTPADEQLELAQEQIECASQALRSALRGLRPRTLLEDGLEDSLKEMASAAPIPTHVTYELQERLDPAVEASLHFVVAEVLANTYRHSRASRVDIRVSQQGRNVVLRMSDDGVGGADPLLGTGLLGMENRAKMLGGSLVIDSPMGGPTVVELTFPVRTPRPTGVKRGRQ